MLEVICTISYNFNQEMLFTSVSHHLDQIITMIEVKKWYFLCIKGKKGIKVRKEENKLFDYKQNFQGEFKSPMFI